MQLTVVMVPCNWLMQVTCNLFMIQGKGVTELGVIGGSYVNMQDRLAMSIPLVIGPLNQM